MAKKSLLMLDQDAYYAGIYANRFESAGWKVWVEETLAGAIKRLKRVHPDVIIVDLEPLVESTGFIAGLRSDPKTAGTLIVGLAKLGDRKTLLKAQEAGVDSYLLKGHFVPSEAVKKVKRLLEENIFMKNNKGLPSSSSWSSSRSSRSSSFRGAGCQRGTVQTAGCLAPRQRAHRPVRTGGLLQ